MKNVQLALISIDAIQDRIYFIRGHRVMLDADLAKVYGVSTKRLNQQVLRNLERFPQDFMFQLKDEELAVLRLQNATSNPARGGRRYRPYAFTEHGAVMVSAVLKTPVAIQTSILIARAFVSIRHWMSTQKDLVDKLRELENKLIGQEDDLGEIFKILSRLMAPTKRKKSRIGYLA